MGHQIDDKPRQYRIHKGNTRVIQKRLGIAQRSGNFSGNVSKHQKRYHTASVKYREIHSDRRRLKAEGEDQCEQSNSRCRLNYGPQIPPRRAPIRGRHFAQNQRNYCTGTGKTASSMDRAQFRALRRRRWRRAWRCFILATHGKRAPCSVSPTCRRKIGRFGTVAFVVPRQDQARQEGTQHSIWILHGMLLMRKKHQYGFSGNFCDPIRAYRPAP